MNQYLLDVYHAAPPSIRNAIASLRGYYLHWYRYGTETERLVHDAHERETWTEDEWRAWHDARLTPLLHRAAREVPYYRRYWASRNGHGGDKPWERLENWPVLTKDEVREDPEAFVADDRSAARMHRLSTSGTSGTPLTLWRTRSTSREWYALFEARWRRWNGVNKDDRWAILGGQLVVPPAQEQPPYWVWNRGLNQLYMSTFHLAPQTTKAYLDALREHRITYLYGYASSMATLAAQALDLGLDAPSLRVALSNAEPLLPHQRDEIERAFGCDAKSTYGMAEMVAGASECEHGELHLWPDAGIVEVFGEDDQPVPAGSAGRFICTGLINDDMPLIRYEVGDRGALREDGATCPCGRTLPLVDRIEGRTIDNLVTADGKRIFWINPIFYGLPIREAQVVQQAYDHVRIRVVPAAEFSDQHSATIRDRLAARMGSIRIDVETVDEIPRTESGKFRGVINNVERGASRSESSRTG